MMRWHVEVAVMFLTSLLLLKLVLRHFASGRIANLCAGWAVPVPRPPLHGHHLLQLPDGRPGQLPGQLVVGRSISCSAGLLIDGPLVSHQFMSSPIHDCSEMSGLQAPCRLNHELFRNQLAAGGHDAAAAGQEAGAGDLGQVRHLREGAGVCVCVCMMHVPAVHTQPREQQCVCVCDCVRCASPIMIREHGPRRAEA